MVKSGTLDVQEILAKESQTQLLQVAACFWNAGVRDVDILGKYLESRSVRWGQLEVVVAKFERDGTNWVPKRKKRSIARSVQERIDKALAEQNGHTMIVEQNGHTQAKELRETEGEFSSEIKAAARRNQEGRCRYCDCQETHYDKMEFHHVIPVRFGGLSNYENCLMLCQKCHKKADGDISKATHGGSEWKNQGRLQFDNEDSAVQAVKEAREKGLDVSITTHHPAERREQAT